MVLYRTRTHLLPCSLILSGVLALAMAFAAGFASAAGPTTSKASGSNERLRQLMTQRYEILQRAMKNSQLMQERGLLDFPTLRNLTFARYRAQADLCTTDAERAAVYEKLVDALTAQEKLLERQAASGRVPEVQVDEGRVATLNARIDLECLRLGQAPAQP
ncbi:MAG: hypothetical protein M1376_04100 [Planctomycetes bacterium]|nr:hypothetical protein [Planctomycetota bacterium]